MENDPETIAFDMNHWFAVVAEDQRYLGRLVVVLKRPCTDLSGVLDFEFDELLITIGIIESALKEIFGATMFNWCCLMNDAWRDGKTPQVHWHVRPRYNHPVIFQGQDFSDPNFGHHYLRGESEYRKVDLDTRKKIASAIRNVVESP